MITLSRPSYLGDAARSDHQLRPRFGRCNATYPFLLAVSIRLKVIHALVYQYRFADKSKREEVDSLLACCNAFSLGNRKKLVLQPDMDRHATKSVFGQIQSMAFVGLLY